MTIIENIKLKTQTMIWSYYWQHFQLPEVPAKDVIPNYKKFEPRIMEGIWLPPYVGDSTFNDYSILISILKKINPAIILELGTASGNTVANMCLESNAKIFTVNALPEQIDGNITTITLNKEDIGVVYRKNGFENRVVQIFEETKKMSIQKYLKSKSVDFAFIDACHDAEFVVNDFLKIFPVISDQAVVIFHDTHPSGNNHLLDSYLGCMFLRKLGYNVKHITDSSIGYWSSEEPTIEFSRQNRIINNIHSISGLLIYGSRWKFIRGLRWLASCFFRGKFNNN